jgi:hypothetical protein
MGKMEWCTVPKYPNYEINEMLEVRNKKVLKIKSCYLDRGYLKLNVDFNGVKYKPYLHQIVAWTFVPNPDGKEEIHHIDEDKLNNHWTNLMWVTRKEHREISKQNEQTAHKLSVKDVLYIREVYDWHNRFKLASQFGVAANTIYFVATGISRKDVGGKIHPLLGIHKKIVNIDTGEIIESATKLSAILGIKRKEIYKILSGKRYNDTPYRYLGMENVVKERPMIELPKTPTAIFDIQGNFIKRFEYRRELYKFLNVEGGRVNQFLKGKCGYIKGYKIKEIDDDGNFIEPVEFISKRKPIKPKKIKNPITPAKQIIKYDLNNNEIERFKSILWASRAMGANKRNFKKQITKSPRNYYKGFIWKYA